MFENPVQMAQIIKPQGIDYADLDNPDNWEKIEMESISDDEEDIPTLHNVKGKSQGLNMNNPNEKMVLVKKQKQQQLISGLGKSNQLLDNEEMKEVMNELTKLMQQ